ncbi:MAG: hypothetical protein QS721_13845 [Candidatus Endonucleobacter sp. (ex Gigantidas childressi)]|nr:hypothetical protein [Candidatus Endonucleobacter sp. (ex Gigantidas childressi)]
MPDFSTKKSGCSQKEIAEIIGKGHSGALVTIVELVTKYTVSA